jgi:hypothetical protein
MKLRSLASFPQTAARDIGFETICIGPTAWSWNGSRAAAAVLFSDCRMIPVHEPDAESGNANQIDPTWLTRSPKTITPSSSPQALIENRIRRRSGIIVAPRSGAPRGNKTALKHGRYTREAPRGTPATAALLRQSRLLVQRIEYEAGEGLSRHPAPRFRHRDAYPGRGGNQRLASHSCGWHSSTASGRRSCRLADRRGLFGVI